MFADNDNEDNNNDNKDNDNKENDNKDNAVLTYDWPAYPYI